MTSRFVCMLLLMTSALAHSDDQQPFQVGFGLGPSYSGGGFNLGYVFDRNLVSVSLGCSAWGTSNGWSCGYGASLASSPKALFSSTKHALSVYLNQINVRDKTFERGHFVERKSEYGAGYIYFNNGLEKSGFTIGGLIGNSAFAESDNAIKLTLQLGYQF